LLETPLAIVPDVRPATPPSPLFSPGSTQTALSLSSRTPRKDKLRQTVKQLRNEIYQLRKMNQTLQEELDKSKQDAINNISLEQYMSLTYKFCPTQELANFINTQGRSKGGGAGGLGPPQNPSGPPQNKSKTH
jgi:hypothetical protein